MYIIEYEPNCWAAPWEGDPPRTIVKENAKRFKSKAAAKRHMNRELKKCESWRKYKKPQVLIDD
jgi:hypothetical protein